MPGSRYVWPAMPLAVPLAFSCSNAMTRKVVGKKRTLRRWCSMAWVPRALAARVLPVPGPPISTRQDARVDALLNHDAMLDFRRKIAPRIVAVPRTKTDGFRDCGVTTEFRYFDASVLAGVLNLINPKRIIQIGAGYSSAAMFDTVDRMKAPKLKSFATIDPDLSRIRRLAAPSILCIRTSCPR